MPQKRIFSFGGGKGEGNKDVKETLGGKGASLAGMSGIGIPAPPGFTITMEVCTEDGRSGKKLPEALGPERRAAVDERGAIPGGPGTAVTVQAMDPGNLPDDPARTALEASPGERARALEDRFLRGRRAPPTPERAEPGPTWRAILDRHLALAVAIVGLLAVLVCARAVGASEQVTLTAMVAMSLAVRASLRRA